MGQVKGRGGQVKGKDTSRRRQRWGRTKEKVGAPGPTHKGWRLQGICGWSGQPLTCRGRLYKHNTLFTEFLQSLVHVAPSQLQGEEGWQQGS